MKKTICLLLSALLMLFTFAGCHEKAKEDLIPEESQVTPISNEQGEEPLPPYNPTMYDRAVDWLTPEFLDHHIVKQFHTSPSSDNSFYTWGFTFTEHSILISSQEEFEEAFAEFPEEVDFEKEMLAVYLFCDGKNGYSCKLKSIESTGQTLKVHFLHNEADPALQPSPPDCSDWCTRCLVVKMDRLEVQALEVELTTEYYPEPATGGGQ